MRGRSRDKGDKEDNVNAWLFFICRLEEKGAVGGFLPPEKTGGCS